MRWRVTVCRARPSSHRRSTRALRRWCSAFPRRPPVMRLWLPVMPFRLPVMPRRLPVAAYRVWPICPARQRCPVRTRTSHRPGSKRRGPSTTCWPACMPPGRRACPCPPASCPVWPPISARWPMPSTITRVMRWTWWPSPAPTARPAPRTGLLRASTICVPRHSGRTVCWLPTGVWMMRTQALLPFPPGQIRLMQVRSVQRMVPVRMMLVRQVNLSGLLPGCAGPKR